MSPPGAPKKVVGKSLLMKNPAVPVKSPFSYSHKEWKKELEQMNAALSVKSKEVDSGVLAWETPTPPPSSPIRGHIQQPFQVHVDDYHKAIRKYPARFSLFVGNTNCAPWRSVTDPIHSLPASFDDATLTQMVHDQFAQYGVCFGYVRRSVAIVRGRCVVKPWIVLQYTNQYDANEALHQTLADADSHVFEGRRARVEASSVKRNVYIYRIDGRQTGGAMLWARLTQFGRLESYEMPSPATCYERRIPLNGLYTQWETYGGYLAAKAMLNGTHSGPYRYIFSNSQ
ncbi:Hypothetical protein R9X50_00457300 [Acrodontium crateriforme]|uniref:Uncharacterized protein n=1 Tax=Acrodontium crateriforme TaxID=150365 RepID=A0AAQ3M874_9PEZI|nr:Hypothetical protein R9X50_00457300 [Acrodontium crateriforme]